jgi:hypothetical protein
VKPAWVSGRNTHSLAIGQARARHFFETGMRLTHILQKDCNIKTLLLPLLGDFITNDIHEDCAEVADVPPIQAIIEAQTLLASGIRSVLRHTDLEVRIVGKVGNHSRTTHKTRSAEELGHSLEYFMYHNLAELFATEKRVKVVIDDAYHTYVKVYDQTLRLHHGHEIRYQGGVGGIYIPANKAINQWNKTRWADLDIFGHFHRALDGGNFILNGSQIGFNPFALRGKFDYEEPKQQLFLLDRDRGKTTVWPILYRGVK